MTGITEDTVISVNGIQDDHSSTGTRTENSVPPTCTKPGSYDTVVYCSICDKELSRTPQSIPAAGHKFGEWEVDYEATATTDGEQQAVSSGENANIWLEVDPLDEKDIPPEEQKRIQDAADQAVGDGAKLTYFDAKLFKQLGSSDPEKITKTTVPIQVTIQIPEELLNKNSLMVRDYKIIRDHEDKVDVIKGTFNEKSGEFTFLTSKFSTYAIGYSDTYPGGGAAPAPETSIQILSPEKTTLTKAGETEKLVAEITPASAADQKLTWTSSDEKVAVVSADGTVTAVGEGTVTITVTTEDGKHSDSVTLVVKYPEEPTPAEDKDLPLLLAKGTGGSNYIKLTWLEDASGTNYEVYWNYCNRTANFKLLKTTKSLTFTHKKLSSKKLYKYYVKAYKMVDGKKVYTAQSPTIHVAMSSTKYTNAKAVTVKSTNITLNVKKTYTLKPSYTLINNKKKDTIHSAQCRYYTTNKAVATVNTKGKITGKKAGKCYVYVIANNGVYKRIRVTVK